MTKRILLLSLAMCLLLAGCGKAPKKEETLPPEPEADSFEPMPGFDAQNKYLMWPESFQETDDFFFGCTSPDMYQHFYDRKTGVSGVLCADPACGHDTKDCAAYIGPSSLLFCQGSKLYWIGAGTAGNWPSLWRSDLNGMNRERLKPIKSEEIIMVYQPQMYAVHRGKLYFWGEADTVVGTEIGKRVSIVSTPLDSSEEYTVLYDEMFAGGTRPSFRFVGNYVFLTVKSYPPEGPSRMTVTKINVNTGESEVVYDEENLELYFTNPWVTQEGEIYIAGCETSRMYLWKVEDGQRVEVTSWEAQNPFPWLFDGVAVNTYIKNDVRWMDIVDFTGKTLYTGEMYPNKVEGLRGDPSIVGDYGIGFTGGDTEKLVMGLSGMEGLENATVLIDLTDNMKATVLWTCER